MPGTRVLTLGPSSEDAGSPPQGPWSPRARGRGQRQSVVFPPQRAREHEPPPPPPAAGGRGRTGSAEDGGPGGGFQPPRLLAEVRRGRLQFRCDPAPRCDLPGLRPGAQTLPDPRGPWRRPLGGPTLPYPLPLSSCRAGPSCGDRTLLALIKLRPPEPRVESRGVPKDPRTASGTGKAGAERRIAGSDRGPVPLSAGRAPCLHVSSGPDVSFPT